jgi:hypothetical protein
MVSVDATFLGLMLHPDAKPPLDPTTQKPTERTKDRIEKLLEDLVLAREKVIVPTPELCEFLVFAKDDGPQYLSELNNLSNFYIRPFDQMAAVELAAIEILARRTGSKRTPETVEVPWQKVKFDRQIIAIAKIHGAHTIYSDDGHIKTFAEDVGIKVICCWELALPVSKMPLIDNAPGPPLDL